MCGICGFASRREIPCAVLKAMNDTMEHRGPDDRGENIFLSGGYHIGLAQRRLAIIDLSPLGRQPMHDANKNISIVFNGEIYNFKELRQELEYPFVTDCDTEVLIAAYLKWGIDCLEHLNGMFSIALYDHRDDTMYLARDRIGEKPLYYWVEDGDIVFASELKPIMECPGFSKDIRQDVLSRYLYHGYIDAPETIFQNVYKLKPGKYLRWKRGNIEERTYWDLLKVYQKKAKEPVTDYEEAKRELRNKLLEAVRCRMIADVPLGTFLSGGYDSSLVTALSQSISKQPIKTFCIGFDDEKYNEAHYAKAIANYLGTNHHELIISEQEMCKLVDSIPQYYDEPFADSSQIPSMLVSKLARTKVTVALSGDAGDEFFCGYSIYDHLPLAQKLDRLGDLVYNTNNLPILRQFNFLDQMPFPVKIIANNRDCQAKTQFINIYYLEKARQLVKQGIPEVYPIEGRIDERDWQKRRMLVDMLTYLPGDVLCKVDRASMKYSLETRCPLLDINVMEYSFRLDHRFKYEKKTKNKKRILKDIAYEYIPKELLDRPKKGFSVPIDKWLKTSLREQLLEISSVEALAKQGIFNKEVTNKMVMDFIKNGDAGSGTGKNFSKIIWNFFVFQMWYQEYISKNY